MRRPAQLAAALFACWAAAAGAQPVFPPGSSLGLAPPQHFAAATGFTGFTGPNNASIVMVELRGADFDQLSTEMTAARLATRGTIERARRPFPLPGTTGLLIEAEQRVGTPQGTITMARWLLLVPAPGMVGMITAQVPLPDATPQARAAIEQALATTVLREADQASARAALPFRFSEAPTLRLALLMGGTTALLAAPEARIGTTEVDRHPSLVLGTSHSAVAMPPGGPAAIAQALLRNAARRPDAITTPPESVRVAGHDAILMRAEATYGPERIATRFAQWLVILPDGRTLTILARAPTETVDAAWPAFRQVVDSVALN